MPPARTDAKPWTLYCLTRTGGRSRAQTYVGVTVDLARRLRQHNGELAGGAKATRGGRWALLYTVTGFRKQRWALQWEWRLHRRGNPRIRCARCRRLAALQSARGMVRVTSQARRSCRMGLRVHYHRKARQCRAGVCCTRREKI